MHLADPGHSVRSNVGKVHRYDVQTVEHEGILTGVNFVPFTVVLYSETFRCLMVMQCKP